MRSLPPGIRKMKHGAYQVRFTYQGREVCEAVRVQGKLPREVTLQDAEEYLIRRKAAVLEHRYVPTEQRNITVGECLNLYARYLIGKGCKTIKQFEGPGLNQYGGPRGSDLRIIDRTLGQIRAVSLTTAGIRVWAQDLRKVYAESTVATLAAVLGAALNQCVADGVLQSAPRLPSLPHGKPRQGFYEPDVAREIIAKLPPDLADIAEFLWLTGRRIGEVLAIRCEWVNVRTRTLTIPETKNGDPAVIPLEGELWTLVERRWQARAFSGWLFHRAGRRIGRTTFMRDWRKVAPAGAIPHDFRRTAVKDLIDAGVDPHVAQQITGHRSSSVFRRYHIIPTGTTRLAVAKLQEFRGQETGQKKVIPLAGR